MSTGLHTQLDEAIRAQLELARAASETKPGTWRAVATHDGLGYDGYSRVLAEEETATGQICRGVAHQIADSLTLVRSNLAGDPPPPAVVAEYIAAWDPATVIRMCQRDLRVLERHTPGPYSAWCPVCDEDPCAEITDLAVAYGLLDPNEPHGDADG